MSQIPRFLNTPLTIPMSPIPLFYSKVGLPGLPNEPRTESLMGEGVGGRVTRWEKSRVGDRSKRGAGISSSADSSSVQVPVLFVIIFWPFYHLDSDPNGD